MGMPQTEFTITFGIRNGILLLQYGSDCLVTGSAISIKYCNVTDRQTDTEPEQIPCTLYMHCTWTVQ